MPDVAGGHVASLQPALADGVVALSSVVRVNGPFAGAIRQAIGDAWIAPSYDGAADASRSTPLPVATLDGDVFRGPHLVSGGGRAEARGILETKREIKELRDRIGRRPRVAARGSAQETAELEATIAHASNAIAALNAEHHKQEKRSSATTRSCSTRPTKRRGSRRRREQLARERHQAEEERDALDRRQEEARDVDRAARRGSSAWPTSG